MGLLRALLARKDRVFVDMGRLVIEPASGNPVPDGWMKDNSHELLCEIASLLGIKVFTYIGYKTGWYGGGKYPGVTLFFENNVTGSDAYACFNADLTRARNTPAGAKGKPLPDGHFTLSRRLKLYKFLKRWGIIEDKNKLSALHEHMGKLKRLAFSADLVRGEQLDKDSIQPLNLSHDQLANAVRNQANNMPTNTRQDPDKTPTTIPDKQSPESKISQGFQHIRTTGAANYGLSKQGNTVTRDPILPIYASVYCFSEKRKRPEDQTIDEWRVAYDSAEMP